MEEKRIQNLLQKLLNTDENENIADIPEYDEIFLNFKEFLFHQKRNLVIDIFNKMIDTKTNDFKEMIFNFLNRADKIPENTDSIILIAGISENFPETVNLQLEQLKEITDFNNRKVITDKEIFTIDDKSTIIIDDALSVENTESGITVFIHISDPSIYISKGDAFDIEAMNRVLNIYLPHKVIPMFPFELSAGLLSLIEQTNKPAVTMEIKFNKQYEMTGFNIYPSLIHITKRLDYITADEILNKNILETNYAPQLLTLFNLAEKLKQYRIRNGAVIFNKPDIKVKLKNDEIIVTKINKDSQSKLIVTELMILANHLMAKFTDENKIPVIYRTQDTPLKPIPEELRIFKEYNPVLFRRLMMKYPSSKFGLYCLPHSTIGLDGYTQYTSPIRRYNDFLIMRQLSSFFNNKRQAYDHNEMLQVFIDIEKKIFQIKTLQNAVKSQYLLEYLKRNAMQEKFLGIVTKKTNTGYIVELSDFLISGFLSCAKQFETGDLIDVYIDTLNPCKNKLRLKI